VPLLHGHTYEFRVAAIGPAGESALSAVARAAVRYPPPPAPTGLRVTPGAGQAVLTWNGSPGLHHWIYYRDVTAGQTRFTRGEFLVDQPSATIGSLTDGHVYEFRVTAVRDGAEGPPGRPVRATPNPPLPPAPAGLRAAVTGPGTLTIDWTPAGAGVHYWVYYRDLTAGERDLTRAAFPTPNPPAQQPLLRAGHEYEVTVSAANRAGEGPQAPSVRLTVPG
jgi:hypothetical protein